MLDDIGDALRFAGNITGDNPPRIDDVTIDSGLIKAMTDGFLERVTELYGKSYAEKLRPYILTAAKLYYYELCIRLLADALVGNKYFVHPPEREGWRPDLNLYMAEVQMKALEQLEELELKEKLKLPSRDISQEIPDPLKSLDSNKKTIIQIYQAI